MARKPPPKRPSRHRSPSPEQIRERLGRERDAAFAELARLGVRLERDEVVGPGESPSEEGDVAQASERRDMGFIQRERLAKRVNRLTRALARVADGTYGRCEECGRAIDPARLAALPEVDLCRECQERRERGRVA